MVTTMITGETPRRATDSEFAIWNDFKRRYDKAAKQIWYCLKCAELAATLDPFVRMYGLVLWDTEAQKKIDQTLATFNRFGRLIESVENQKYFITIERGEITISAPQKMTRDEYESDQFPEYTLGLWPLVVLVVAVVLLVSANTAVEISGDIAANDARDLQRQILDADQAMAQKPADVRAAYLQFKQSNKAMFEAAAAAAPKEEKGLWSQFLSGAKGFAQVAGIAALGFILFSIANNRRK